MFMFRCLFRVAYKVFLRPKRCRWMLYTGQSMSILFVDIYYTWAFHSCRSGIHVLSLCVLSSADKVSLGFFGSGASINGLISSSSEPEFDHSFCHVLSIFLFIKVPKSYVHQLRVVRP